MFSFYSLLFLRLAARAQFLLIRDVFTCSVHAHFLIEPCCTCGILRIDAQTDCRCAALIELAKRVAQQCFPETAFAPGTADSQCANPADTHAVTVQGKAGNLVPIPGDCPEVRVELGVVEPAALPLFQ